MTPGFSSGAICGRCVHAINAGNNKFGDSPSAAEFVLFIITLEPKILEEFAF
jgi:hypothetical protein